MEELQALHDEVAVLALFLGSAAAAAALVRFRHEAVRPGRVPELHRLPRTPPHRTRRFLAGGRRSVLPVWTWVWVAVWALAGWTLSAVILIEEQELQLMLSLQALPDKWVKVSVEVVQTIAEAITRTQQENSSNKVVDYYHSNK